MGLVCLPKFTIKKSTIHVGKMEHKSGRNATLIFIFLIPKDPCMVYLPHLVDLYGKLVGKYTIRPMDPGGKQLFRFYESPRLLPCFSPTFKGLHLQRGLAFRRRWDRLSTYKNNDSPKKLLLSIAIC